MEAFFKTIAAFIELEEEARSALAAILTCVEAPKGHLLLRPHSVCNHIYFVEKGLTRTFYTKDDKDITDWLSPEGTFACSVMSFINRHPDRRGIELLEDATLWALQYDELEQAYRQHHELERMGRLIVGSGLVQVQQRFDDLHFATAAERYQKLMSQYPFLIQRTPLGMVASYLGITQETLSRIRSHFTPHSL
ncbi:MAG: Crp/Fnr family transcriptional regulator [Williamsia sp.]|nr:Crp/Fnr family transcriptional regulator [Williamsia sp.]